MDPALPGFSHSYPKDRLDKGDAAFVDVIHTNGKASHRAKGLGFLSPLGHADFYPNGGNFQLGCRTRMDDLSKCFLFLGLKII